MKISGIAFDCCWLIELDDQGFDEKYAAMQLVERMINNGVEMLFDHEGHIHREYSRYMRDMSTGKAIVEKLTKNAIRYVSGTPKSDCASALAADGFDPSDVPYVGTAQNGKGALITSEEKHLEPARCALIVERCHVYIVGSADIEDLLS